MKKVIFTSLSLAVCVASVAFAQTSDYQVEVKQTLDTVQNQLLTVNPATEVLKEASVDSMPPQMILEGTPDSQSGSQEETRGESKTQPAQSLSEKKNIIVDVLELKDMDIGDVLKLISKKTGLNIVTGQNVKGKVTIYLKNVEVRDVLQIILESNDLAYIEENGIIRVMTAKDYELTYGHRFGEKTQVKIAQLKNTNAADAMNFLIQMKSTIGKVIVDDKSNTIVLMDTPEKLAAMTLLIKEIDVPIMTKVFDLSYAKAEDLSAKITETLTKNVGTMKFDKRSNKIIVNDTSQKLQEIEKMVKAFDEKHEEVLIAAKIVQIILSDQYKMGVDWEAIVSNYHSLDLKNSFSVLSSGDKRGKLSIGTISNEDYTVLIEALDTVGKTNILSSPHITAINNEEAKILVGSTEPYVTTTTTTPSSGPTTTAESVNFIEVGVKLYVTPTIHNDRNITMKIKPEVSSVTRFVTTGNNNKIPVVETSQAETTVLVKDNVTIVIGGLIKDEKVESINKVPLLGDLPLVGFAFRNRDQLLRKTELVIFLTPKIITGDVSAESQLTTMSNKMKQN